MNCPFQKHKRRSIRLQGYDYASDGAYFVTICVQNKECLLGDIKNGGMVLNDAGKMVQKWWKKLETKFSNITLDEHVIMPNHFHGILMIANKTKSVGAIPCNRPHDRVTKNHFNQGENTVSPLQILNSYHGLGRYISWFKRMSANEYIQNVKSGKFLPFEKRIWQRNYYEHIIRNEKDYFTITQYILDNPMKWEIDEYYSS